MAMTGTKDVHPMKFGSPAIDYATGMTGAFALSAALFQRERTGRGQRIDMAMLDVAMILMSSHITGYLRNGVHPKPHGNRHPHATNGAFATKDGTLVMLGASNMRQQKRLWTRARAPRHGQDDSNDERDADHDREIAVLRGDHADAHRGRMGGIPAGAPRAGGARAHHGRGDGRSADRDARRRSTATMARPASRAASACRSRRSRSPTAARASTRRRPRSAQHNEEIFAELARGRRPKAAAAGGGGA